jgi:hypothetical protein
MQNVNYSDKFEQNPIFLLITPLRGSLALAACVVYILIRTMQRRRSVQAQLTDKKEGTTMQLGESTTLLSTSETKSRKSFFIPGIFDFFARKTRAKSEEEKKTAEQKGLLKDIEDFSEESAQIAADIKLINELTCRSIDELQAQVRKLKERLDILRSRVGESTRTVGARKSEKSSDYSEYKVLQSQMLELMERGKRYQALDIPPSVTTFTSIKIQEIRTQIKDQSTARREIHRQIIAIASQMLDIDDIAVRESIAQDRAMLTPTLTL